MMWLQQIWANIVNGRNLHHEYLCGAVDHSDLERRMREIDRGIAPHQLRSRVFCRSSTYQ